MENIRRIIREICEEVILNEVTSDISSGRYDTKITPTIKRSFHSWNLREKDNIRGEKRKKLENETISESISPAKIEKHFVVAAINREGGKTKYMAFSKEDAADLLNLKNIVVQVNTQMKAISIAKKLNKEAEKGLREGTEIDSRGNLVEPGKKYNFWRGDNQHFQLTRKEFLEKFSEWLKKQDKNWINNQDTLSVLHKFVLDKDGLNSVSSNENEWESENAYKDEWQVNDLFEPASEIIRIWEI